jgi:hypothetical protein
MLKYANMETDFHTFVTTEIPDKFTEINPKNKIK